MPYLREAYSADWGGDEATLASDIAHGRVSIFIADVAGNIIGFAAYVMIYDLHWCVRGAEVIDLYVAPQHRGRGIALQMLATVAAGIQSNGGVFLKGGAAENAAVKRFYTRAALMAGNGECYLSGRAFKHIAGFAGKPVREMVRSVPDPAWNLE